MGARVVMRFVADVHIGNHKRFGGELVSGVNDRCRRILGVLEHAAEGVDTLVVLGDLFDTSHPTPQVMAATLRALNTPMPNRVVLLLGNHDMVSDQAGDNALAVFDALPLLMKPRPTQYMVVDRGPEVYRDDATPLYLLPFRPAPMADWFGDAVAQLHEDNITRQQSPILCFHGGVRDHNTPRFLWASPDAIDVDLLFDVMRSCGSKLAVCGNWHNHRVWRRDGMMVVQVGALVPTGFDNPGPDYGHVVDIFEDGPVLTGRQLPGPRFLTLTADEACRWQGPPQGADGCYLRVKAADSDGSLREGFQGGADVLALEVVESGADTTQQAEEAAEAARTGETLESSLRDYVQSMLLEAGVDRAAVEAKVMNYMARE